MTVTAEEQTPIEYSMGDANLDGNVNTRDVVLIKQSIVGLAELTDKQKVFADVYADGQINTRDVVLIQQYIVGMEVDLGIHEHDFSLGNTCICGYEKVEEHTHEYSKLEKSATQHWYECSCGAKSGIESHNPGAEATETTAQKCTECGYVITPALGHVHTKHLIKVDAKAQSCTEEGNKEYYKCDCGKWFEDERATKEITDKTSVVLFKNEHTYNRQNTDGKYLKSVATCMEKAVYYYSCSCGEIGTSTFKYGTALGHSFTFYVSDNNATCVNDGTETATCDNGCGTTDTKTVENSALKHDYGNWVSNGNGTHTKTCKHDGTHTVTENCHGGTATCIEKAKCSICGDEYGEMEEHIPKRQWKNDESYHWHECETDGCSYHCNKTKHTLGSDKKCTICGYVVTEYLFTITWKNYDGTILEEDKNVMYGTVPTYDGETPTREKDKQYTYTFSGWSPSVESATESVTYTAQFSYATNKYKVQFVDHDGSVLDEQTIEYGQSATLPTDPYREGYRFTGWIGSYENIIDDVTIEASYVRQFTVQFVDYDNSVIDIQLIDNNENAVRPKDPVRNNYRFSGWDTEDTLLNNVTSDLTVKATYVRLYNVKFIDWDGTVLDEQVVEYKQSATSPEKTPNRTGYTFVSWDQDYSEVVSDMQISAVYKINRYTVIFKMPDGTVLKTKENIAHGTTIFSPKTEDTYFDWKDKKGYRFKGWKDSDGNPWDDSQPIESNATIVADYSEEITEPIIAIETKEICQGTRTVEIKIALGGSFEKESVYGISLRFGYAEKLGLNDSSVLINSDLKNVHSVLKTDIRQYELFWIAESETGPKTKGFEIVTLTFNIGSDVELGEYAIDFLDGTYIVDEDLNKIIPVLIAGKAIITE